MRVDAQMPAFTLPMPHLTMTTSLPLRLPSTNSIAATSEVFSMTQSRLIKSTSASIAPIIPILSFSIRFISP
jgi:hypothetical protein